MTEEMQRLTNEIKGNNLDAQIKAVAVRAVFQCLRGILAEVIVEHLACEDTAAAQASAAAAPAAEEKEPEQTPLPPAGNTGSAKPRSSRANKNMTEEEKRERRRAYYRAWMAKRKASAGGGKPAKEKATQKSRSSHYGEPMTPEQRATMRDIAATKSAEEVDNA